MSPDKPGEIRKTHGINTNKPKLKNVALASVSEPILETASAWVETSGDMIIFPSFAYITTFLNVTNSAQNTIQHTLAATITLQKNDQTSATANALGWS